MFWLEKVSEADNELEKCRSAAKAIMDELSDGAKPWGMCLLMFYVLE